MADAGLFKKLYNILTWSSLIGLIFVMILVFRKSPAPEIPADPTAAARAEKKFEAADQAKAAGQPGQVALAGTDTVPGTNGASAGGQSPAGGSGSDPAAVLSSGEQPSIDEIQSSVKDVKVDMVGDVVKAYVIFDFHGKDLSLELDGHLSADNGYMKFVPISGKLGSLPLPQSTLNEAVDKLMSSPENREKLKLPSDISDIKIEDGHAVVQYK